MARIGHSAASRNVALFAAGAVVLAACRGGGPARAPAPFAPRSAPPAPAPAAIAFAAPDDHPSGSGGGPHGAPLPVGRPVSTDGTPGVPADSPSLPSPYRVTATPAHDPTNPLAGLCNPGAGTIWGWT